MDATTLAQAVQAATQQAQQQASSHPSPTTHPSQATHTTAVDNLTCQWQGCGERTDSPETLYDHVCERHIGRKSTNNLSLTCQWGACRTTTVKRDHITSHIRVHVPLKPHKCNFCQKSFKRPQDLKKHVKTHADDSVIAGSPQESHNGRSNMDTHGMPHNGKPAGYYTAGHDNGMHPFPSYQSNGNGSGYAGLASNQYAGYGSVNYPNNSIADIQSMDTRRRAIEALNDFLGDIKRRAINPSSYYDVGQRLQGTSLPLPVGTGYNTGYNSTSNSYNSMSAASLLEAFNHNHGDLTTHGAAYHAPVAQPNYSLPITNARTKDDLQDIDRFLEQLQATVYETSNQAAAAGVQQPGMHAQFTGDYSMGHVRSSNSPPYQNVGGANSFGSLTMHGPRSTSTGFDSPLTPASISSYCSSGQSPMSSNGRSSTTSIGGIGMYPSLPSVTGMSDLGSGYPTTTSAPASSLASGFDGLDGRRYSGGRLQRAAPSQDTEMSDAQDRETTPKVDDGQRGQDKAPSSIDPALRGGGDTTSESTPSPDDKRQEDWIENIRAIEALRKWISSRLEQGDFEATSAADSKDVAPDKFMEQMVDATKVEPPATATDEQSEESKVSYPSLPSA